MLCVCVSPYVAAPLAAAAVAISKVIAQAIRGFLCTALAHMPG